MALYRINIYQQGTTDGIGSGTVDGDFFIAVKDRDGALIGYVLNSEISVPIVDENRNPLTGTWDATNNEYVITGFAPIENNVITNGITIPTTLDTGDSIIVNGVTVKTLT